MKREAFFATSVFCMLATSGYAGLVAHYKFDEIGGPGGDTVAANEVPGGTPGQIGANVKTSPFGRIGGCYFFEGTAAGQDDIVDMGNASFLSEITASGQLTFSSWIATSDKTGNRNTVFCAANTGSGLVYADMGVAAGADGYKGAVTARIRPPQITGMFSYPESTTEEEPEGRVNDSNWHHIVMTVNRSAGNPSNSTVAIYVDGVLANSSVIDLTNFPSFNLFEIGRLTRLNGGTLQRIDQYTGYVDDVQVYSMSLTPEEVQFLYDHPGEVVIRPDPPDVDLVVTSARIDGPGFLISFTGAPSTTYNVRGSLDLQSFDINEGTTTTDSAGDGAATIPLIPGRPRQFYRIEEVANP